MAPLEGINDSVFWPLNKISMEYDEIKVVKYNIAKIDGNGNVLDSVEDEAPLKASKAFAS